MRKAEAAAAALAAAAAAALGVTYKLAFYSRPGHDEPYRLPRGEQYLAGRERMLSLIRRLDAVEYEPVYITACDGVRLFGRYYHVRDGAPLQIEFHGYRGSALRDFCGGRAGALARHEHPARRRARPRQKRRSRHHLRQDARAPRRALLVRIRR